MVESIESPVKTPNPYDKENEVLRPLLKKYKNVEDNVLTLRMKNVDYQLIEEDKPPLSNVSYKKINSLDWASERTNLNNNVL